LPTLSTILSLSVLFCASGTSTAEEVNGNSQWPAVSSGSVL
jgi:hypothetical protein